MNQSKFIYNHNGYTNAHREGCMIDESHYNTAGTAFIADRYIAAMDTSFEN